jgi:hypothetical protein
MAHASSSFSFYSSSPTSSVWYIRAFALSFILSKKVVFFYQETTQEYFSIKKPGNPGYVAAFI